jgi:hypothetical protein
MSFLRITRAKKSIGRLFIVLLSLFTTMLLVVSINASSQGQADSEASVLAQAAKLTGEAESNLEALNVVTANYPALGEQATVAKVYNRGSGELIQVTLDAEGAAIDRNLSAENLAAEIANGPLQSSVTSRLAQAAPDELISVAFWVPGNLPDSVRPDGAVDRETLEAAKVEAYNNRVADLAAARQGFLAALAATGFSPDYVSPSTPLIAATLPASQVLQLAGHPDVVHVFLNEGRYENAGVGDGDPVRTSRGYQTHKFLDLSGATIQVGVLECCGHIFWSNLYAGHPYMRGINTNQTGCVDQSHPTAVAGFINSGHTIHRGQAYNAHLNFDSPCDGSISGVETSLDWLDSAPGNFADPVNHSYGLDSGRVVGSVTLDASLDDKVRNSADTHVVAAGNNCNGFGSNTCNVGSPALAYNVIAVGNIDDNQTWTWTDDTMSTSSSYVDPLSTHGDREEPDVSAAGDSLDSAIPSSPWIGFVGTGTSFASPIVTAAAAVLLEADGVLGSWPEEVRAILMATAWNDNADGAIGLSEEDGAGGIDAFRATQVAQTSTNGNSGHLTASCGGTYPTTLTTFTQAAGRRIRVVIAWDTNPTYADYANQPSSDFDLHVTGPGGLDVWSSSWDNTYEFVTFLTPANGIYTVDLHMFRCDEPSGSTFLGWSWARKS